MGQASEYIRSYIDDGRLQHLIWFAVASFGIAFVEWSLSPVNVHLWLPPVAISDGVYFNMLFVLAFAWIGVVGVGIIKCGWPGLVLLVSAKWGLFPFYLIGALEWACRFRGQCL